MNKRFELKVNHNDYCDIVDWVESKEKNAICIYNDLGCYYFSSAPQLCDLLNSLYEENIQLQEDNEELSAMKSNGLKVLEFYEYKLKNADKKEFDNAREELWIVKEVLSEMGVIKDE